MSETAYLYAAPAPYPPIQVCGRNPRYAAAMLSNAGSCNSEMSAVSLYFYNSLVTKEYGGDIAECFHHISIVEMHHLGIFGQLALLLGADPRLWSFAGGRHPTYWTPACNRYPKPLKALLDNAIRGEEEAIRKYRQQAEWIQDPHIVANLDRIILDEEHHIQIFHELYASYVGGCPQK